MFTFLIKLMFTLFVCCVCIADVQVELLYTYQGTNAQWPEPIGMALKGTNVFLTNERVIEKLFLNQNMELKPHITRSYSNKFSFSHVSVTPSNVIAGSIKWSPDYKTNWLYIWNHDLEEIAICSLTKSITSVLSLNDDSTLIVFLQTDGTLVLATRHNNELNILEKLNLFTYKGEWFTAFCDMQKENNKIYVANTLSNCIEIITVTNNLLKRTGTFGIGFNKPDGIYHDIKDEVFIITLDGINWDKAHAVVLNENGNEVFQFSFDPLGGDLTKIVTSGNGIFYCVTDWHVLINRIRALLCPSNSINDSTSTGNTNNLIDPGEDFDLKIALENWCWTNISPSAWIDVEKTIATNSSPQTDILTNWFSLPQTTGFFNNISHREVGWQTNSFPFFMPTNPQAAEIILCFKVSALPVPSNFNVCTTIKLNNPDAIYNPTSLFLKTGHSVVTNIPLVITNAGTRELVSVCTNNGIESWWSINPVTNIVASGSSTFAYVSVDSSLLTTTDGIFYTSLFFAENEHFLWNPDSSNFYDAGGTIVPFKIIASENQPPVWLYPTNFSRYEWTGTLDIILDATDDWTSLLDYEMLEGPATATNFGWIIIEWEGNLDLAMRTGIWEYPFTVTATDKGIPPLTSTQKFVVTVKHLNFPCDIDVRFDYPNPYYIDEGSPWNGLVEITDMNDEDAPFLTMWASNLPPIMTFEPVTNHSNFYWLDFPSPVEGEEYSNIVFHGSDNYAPHPYFAKKSSPTLIVVPEPFSVFLLEFTALACFFFARRRKTAKKIL